jgi:two-component system chemotaxis response regulator CheY
MPKLILVVDDSMPVRQQLGMTLKNAGYDVVGAENAEDGMAQLRGTREVSLLICDINMPQINGLAFVEQIRTFAHCAKLPIIMLTTVRTAAAIERAKKAGVSGWLVKPYNPEALIAVARKLAGEP